MKLLMVCQRNSQRTCRMSIFLIILVEHCEITSETLVAVEQSHSSETCCVCLGQVTSTCHPVCEQKKRERERKRQTGQKCLEHFPGEVNVPKAAYMGSKKHTFKWGQKQSRKHDGIVTVFLTIMSTYS